MESSLTTIQKEMIRAVKTSDYSYFMDLGGMEHNIKNGGSLLLLAASVGNIPMIQMIMANPTLRLNYTDEKGENAIFYATKSGRLDIVKELRKRGCHLQKSKISGYHPAHTAWRYGWLDIVKYFMEEINLDPDILTQDGLTMIMLAWIKNRYEITEYLLEKGADPDIETETGVTAVYLAAKYGCSRSLTALLKYTKNINVTCDLSKSTPIMAAVENGNIECVKTLLMAKANLSISNVNNEDVYILASQTPQVDVLKFILALYVEKGLDIDKESELDNMNMFMRAVYTDNYKNAKYLKRKGAQVNFKNSKGDTILHIALKNKWTKMIAFCLFVGWNKQIENNDGISFEKLKKDPDYEFLEALEKKVIEKTNQMKRNKFEKRQSRAEMSEDSIGTLDVLPLPKTKSTKEKSPKSIGKDPQIGLQVINE